MMTVLAAVLRRQQTLPSSYSESSGLTAQEDVMGMSDLGER